MGRGEGEKAIKREGEKARRREAWWDAMVAAYDRAYKLG